jgi:hypothetical protein
MSEQSNQAQEKMALEINILRQEVKLKEKELELKEKELKDLATRKTWKIDPVTVGIIAALIGFLGNVIATFLQGRSSLILEDARYNASRSLETDKFHASRSLETDKFRSSLILEAIKTGDTEKAARNIEFFLDAGFIEDKSGKIAQSLSERKVPVLPPTSPDLRAGEPVERLPLGDPYRQIASAVGLLATPKGGFCTAWVISKDYLITANYCISTVKPPVTLRMGFISQQGSAVEYPVDPDPVEIDDKLGYAIVRVQGNPSERFGTVSLATRTPVLDEPLFILHHSEGKQQAITRDDTCRVTKAQFDSMVSFGHTCENLGGSGGAPVIATRDFAVLGLHHSGRDDEKWNTAKQFVLIIQRSKILQRVIAEASPSN